jgi:hypothetical protein
MSSIQRTKSTKYIILPENNSFTLCMMVPFVGLSEPSLLSGSWGSGSVARQFSSFVGGFPRGSPEGRSVQTVNTLTNPFFHHNPPTSFVSDRSRHNKMHSSIRSHRKTSSRKRHTSSSHLNMAPRVDKEGKQTSNQAVFATPSTTKGIFTVHTLNMPQFLI